MSENTESGKLTLIGDKALLMLTAQALLNSNKKSSKIALISILLNVVLVIAVCFLVNSARNEKIIPIGLTPSGQAVPLKVIEGELFSPPTVAEWAGKKAKLMHTFTFRTINNGEHAVSLNEYAHQAARDTFLESIRRDGLIKDVTDKNAVVYAEFYKDKQPMWIREYISPSTGTKLHVVEVILIVTIDARSSTGNDRNRQVIVPMEMHIGEVGLGKAKDGLLIGSIKRVVSK